MSVPFRIFRPEDCTDSPSATVHTSLPLRGVQTTWFQRWILKRTHWLWYRVIARKLDDAYLAKTITGDQARAIDESLHPHCDHGLY